MAHSMLIYAAADGDAALEIQMALDAAGFLTVMDPAPEHGWTYHFFLEGWLRESWVVIVLATPDACTDSLVSYLWAYALGAGKPVLPLIPGPAPDAESGDLISDADNFPPPLAACDPVPVAQVEDWLARLRSVAADVCAAVLPRVDAADAPALAQAREMLFDAAPHTRGVGVRQIAGSDTPLATDLLRAATQHPVYADVRFAAVEALGQQRAVDTLPLLIARLSDGADRVVQAAITALAAYGTDAIDPLVAVITGDDRTARRAAILALVQINAGDTVPGLIAALSVQDWHVARTAAVRLGELRDMRAVDALRAVLDSEDESLVALAQRALARLGVEGA